MKYYIKTFGCQMNFSDSERLASFLESYQMKPAQKIEQADFVILNTCGIRQMAEDRGYGQVNNLKKTHPEIKIVLTGCIAHRPDVQLRMRGKVDLFTNIKDFPDKFSRFISKESKNKKSAKKNKIPSKYLSITPKHISSFQANVPIMTGCNNFCAYCVVPYARGREASRPHKEIIKEVKYLVKKGYKEITLLGQNVNSYNSPSTSGRGVRGEKINFSKLLKKINNIPEEFWIRFMSSHPKDMSNELIKTITKLEKVCESVHLPIQSGDNVILKKMNRKYTQAHYLKLVDKIKESFEKNKPGIIYSISTDIIVGFPRETKKQFFQSAEVMKKVGYDMVYFGQFSPRPGTAAWNMRDNVTKKEKVRREKYLNEILKKSAYANNKKYVGKIYDILIENEKNGFYYGKTRTFKNVKMTIPQNCHPRLDPGSRTNRKDPLFGQIIPVKITKANIWNLEACPPKGQGEICEKNLPASKQVIVIAGPTASGKSSVAIKLAKKFNGEIISADSRQIYRGMDIGSGKITKTEQKMAPHHMLDIVSPNTEYNVAKFKKRSLKHIEDILSHGKLPIICGGTGFWIKAIVDNVDFPQVKPDWKLRKKLEQKSNEKLFEELKKLDPERAKSIDKNNKVRLIRAIEICKTIGKVPALKCHPEFLAYRQVGISGSQDKKKKMLKQVQHDKYYEFLQIGIKRSKEQLHQRIKLNVKKRFRNGMVKEVKNLHKKGISWRKLKSFGLSYALVPEFIKEEIKTKEKLLEKIYLAEKKYAKRQLTWFKKDKRIKWIKDYESIEKEIRSFIKNK